MARDKNQIDQLTKRLSDLYNQNVRILQDERLGIKGALEYAEKHWEENIAPLQQEVISLHGIELQPDTCVDIFGIMAREARARGDSKTADNLEKYKNFSRAAVKETRRRCTDQTEEEFRMQSVLVVHDLEF